MTARPGERIEIVSPDLARLDLAEPDEPAPALPRRRGTAWLALSGSCVLAVGLAVLWTAGFVQDQFARSTTLGVLTLAVAVAGFGLLMLALVGELRGLWGLHRVDRLRQDLHSGEAGRIVAAARVWLGEVPGGRAMRPAVDAINDPDAVLALLRSGPAEGARRGADLLGRRAARQAVAALAAAPSPALATAVVAWRGTRLIREVAGLYGVRPGTFATLGLLRRTAVSASLVGTTELAVNAATHALLSSPFLAHALGDVAGAGLAARRLLVLARAASAACDPTLPPEERET